MTSFIENQNVSLDRALGDFERLSLRSPRFVSRVGAALCHVLLLTVNWKLYMYVGIVEGKSKVPLYISEKSTVASYVTVETNRKSKQRL